MDFHVYIITVDNNKLLWTENLNLVDLYRTVLPSNSASEIIKLEQTDKLYLVRFIDVNDLPGRIFPRADLVASIILVHDQLVLSLE